MLVKPRTIKTKTSEIWIDDENILRVKVLEGAELTYEETVACFNAYRELGCDENNKMIQLMDASVNATMTKEARDYVAENGQAFFIASAVVTNNFVVRLIANFINKFYKLGFPFKVFESETKALEWLLKFRR